MTYRLPQSLTKLKLRPSHVVFAAVVGLSVLSAGYLKQVPVAFAQQEQNQLTLTAIPPRVGDTGELLLKPGEKKQITVQVRNDSDKQLEVETFVRDFIIADDGSTPVQVKENVSNRWSLAKWVTLTPPRQIIPAHKKTTINVLIEVPADALPGGHYAMILHRPAGAGSSTAPVDEVTEAAGSGISQQVGSLLYVRVDGPITEQLFIRDFTFKPNFAEFGPMPFEYTVENKSDIHMLPRASVEIFNIFNQRIDTITMEAKNVFPLAERKFSNKWSRVWGFGPYRADLKVSYGSTGQLVQAHSTFWILPVRLIIAVLTGLLTLVALFLSVKRHLDHNRAQTAAKNEAAVKDTSDSELDSQSTDQPPQT